MSEAELEAALAASLCTVDAAGRLIHPGLPLVWGSMVVAFMVVVLARAAMVPSLSAGAATARHFNLTSVPIVGDLIGYVTTHGWVLVVLKIVVAGLFLMLIFAGLFGTPIPERNAATVLTWNLWWAGLIVSVFFLGSAWCAVCPWDTLASLLVRARLWGQVTVGTSLNMRVPKILRSVWPAFFLLLGLTWLELGVGVTTSPYATAVLALAIVVLTTLSMALFERKAFCRYFCPVGRTVGAYSQLAPIELRPIDTDICARCTTLECYHGTDTIEPCPTHLVMGRLQQNTYCTSCGNCAQSCPDENVAWRVRSPSVEAIWGARPHWDEAFFMLGLLALTGFHGLVMTGMWEDWIRNLGLGMGESGQMLGSFTIGFGASLIVPVAFFALCVWLSGLLNTTPNGFTKQFSQYAFVALPLAFAYHIAHNLNHLLLENRDLGDILLNPLGTGTLPLSRFDKLIRGSELWLSQDMLNALQSGLIALGFAIAVSIVMSRSLKLDSQSQYPQVVRCMPLLFFAAAMSGYHLWLLMQPMVMRY